MIESTASGRTKKKWTDYTVPNSLFTLRRRTPGLKYEPSAVREAAEKLKTNKYADLAREKKKGKS